MGTICELISASDDTELSQTTQQNETVKFAEDTERAIASTSTAEVVRKLSQKTTTKLNEQRDKLIQYCEVTYVDFPDEKPLRRITRAGSKTANEKLSSDIVILVKFIWSQEKTNEFYDIFKKSSANRAHTTNSEMSEKTEKSAEQVLAQHHVVTPENQTSTCENCEELKYEISQVWSMLANMKEKQNEECTKALKRATESEAKFVNIIFEHSNMAAEIEYLKATVEDLEIENSTIKNVLDVKQNKWIQVDCKKGPTKETEVLDNTDPVLYNSFSALGIEEPEEDAEALTYFPALGDEPEDEEPEGKKPEEEVQNVDTSQTTKNFKEKSKPDKTVTPKLSDHSQNKTIVIGDSMVKGIDRKKIERAARGKSVCHSYSGARVNQIKEKFQEHRNKEQYDCVLLHVGTNDLVHQKAEKVAANMEKLIEEVKMHSPKVSVSSVIQRYDGRVNSNKIKHYNDLVNTLCSKHNINFINNDNIDKSFLNGSNLHLNREGNKALGSAFCTFVKSFRFKTSNSVSVPQGDNNHFFHHAYGHPNREWLQYLKFVSQRLLNK